jgi:hypothetical protein
LKRQFPIAMRRKRDSAAKQTDNYLRTTNVASREFANVSYIEVTIRLMFMDICTWSHGLLIQQITEVTIRLTSVTTARGKIVKYHFQDHPPFVCNECTWSNGLHFQDCPPFTSCKLYVEQQSSSSSAHPPSYWLHAEKWPSANRHWDNSQRLKQSLAPVTWCRYLSVH